ncbi:hypothetical protein T484DRAFT_1782956 [Baffinella frigidus]|nr:hypothetical protein T484DRAFT_1782956 [Cryptophyta sp. CCMP2293]
MRSLFLALAACAGAHAFAPAATPLSTSASAPRSRCLRPAHLSAPRPARGYARLGLRAQLGGNVPDLSKEEQEKAIADEVIKMDKAKACKTALKGASVYLVGLPGLDIKGVGMMLAMRLGNYRFLDITEVLAPTAQQPDLSHSTKELIARIGEGDYRKFEGAILDQVQGMLRCVVATDSGVVLDGASWEKLRENVVVFLQADVETLAGAQEEYSRAELDAELGRCGEKMLAADVLVNLDPKLGRCGGKMREADIVES